MVEHNNSQCKATVVKQQKTGVCGHNPTFDSAIFHLTINPLQSQHSLVAEEGISDNNRMEVDDGVGGLDLGLVRPQIKGKSAMFC
jgi:hypothetical protein